MRESKKNRKEKKLQTSTFLISLKKKNSFPLLETQKNAHTSAPAAFDRPFITIKKAKGEIF